MHKSLLSAALLLSLSVGCSMPEAAPHNFETEKNFFAMDTAVSFKGSSSGAEKTEDILYRLDELFNRYSEKSDIYALNRRENQDISDYTKEIISSACALSDKYGSDVNIFAGDITDCWNISSDNPRIPSDEEIAAALNSSRNALFLLDKMSFADGNGSIDLGSVAKGYALDKVREVLGKDELCIVSSSSSILLNGKKPDGKKFNVSIRDPENGEKMLGTIKTDACFISTSGGYERFFEIDGEKFTHIFDLNSGRPAETDLTSVTVMCGSGIESDFLSTLIYIGGTDKLSQCLGNDSFKAVAVTENREIYLSNGIDFKLSPDSGYIIKEFSDE